MTMFTDAAIDRVAKAIHGQVGAGTVSWEIYRSTAKVHLAACLAIASIGGIQITEPEPPKVDPDEELGQKILDAARGVHGTPLAIPSSTELARMGAVARKLLQP